MHIATAATESQAAPDRVRKKPGRPKRDPNAPPKLCACEIRVVWNDITTTRVSSQNWSEPYRRRVLRQRDVESVELVRRLTRAEYLELRDAAGLTPGNFKNPAELRLRDQRYAAVELVATFDDGHEERAIVRRASSRRRIRIFESRPGISSVVKARRLTMEEWKALRVRSPAGRPSGRPIDRPTTRSGVYAWEILFRQLGKTRTVRVVCATEVGAIDLIMAIENVDAAVAVRPLSFEEYRGVAV